MSAVHGGAGGAGARGDPFDRRRLISLVVGTPFSNSWAATAPPILPVAATDKLRDLERTGLSGSRATARVPQYGGLELSAAVPVPQGDPLTGGASPPSPPPLTVASVLAMTARTAGR
jgi:hypothetical protein